MSTTADPSPDPRHLPDDVRDRPEPEPEPEAEAGRRRRPRRAVRRGTESTVVSGTSADERAEGWGDESAPRRGAPGENDDRLLGDVPPHYGRH
ncbi:hypothetical protein [Cellulosimicrobium sp. KWT-B]|uniref:hypothetical protein n=1 Tax=Cellulosimicrobium sp. KWT-B TaxID=1981152 RepID=UPI001177B7C0|nr:hypothetical protein [Cellulosimicrobium sp. KWT-B]